MNKKEKIKFIFINAIIMTIISSVSVFASNYFYTGYDIGYDNSQSGIAATDVQGAIDDLREKATNYNEIREENEEIKSNMQPVGSIYMSMTDDTVAKVEARYGGTWQAIGQGRTIIGAGTGTDSNSTSRSFTVGSTGGEYSHKLVLSETPKHNHTGSTGGGVTAGIRVVGAAGTTYAANHVCGYQSASFKDTGSTSNFPGANHYHNFTTSEKGGDGYHNNIQPYITVYIYKRVS